MFDNRLQFASEVFRQFCETNAIRHIRVSPYHPSSNGAAERLVQTFKESMKNQTVKQPQLCLDNFLLSYRATPQSTTNRSSAEMMLGRPLRTKLSLVKPDVTADNACKQASQKDYHDRTSCSRAFMVGERVQAQNPRCNAWEFGVVVERSGPVSYTIQLDNSVCWTRHINHLQDSTGLPEIPAPMDLSESARCWKKTPCLKHLFDYLTTLQRNKSQNQQIWSMKHSLWLRTHLHHHWQA